MRRAFIAFSILLFLAYAWASVAYQNRVAVPDSPEAESELLDRKYLLRDSIYTPAGEALYFGGAPVDGEMLDALRSAGVTTITVSGFAPAVNFQLGTALMVALIFFAFVAALKPVVWDPFTLMLEKRMKQLAQGTEAQRRNQLEADRFAAEKERRNAEMARDIQALRLDGQRETAKEANALVRAARDREKEVKFAGLRDIAAAAETAREAMEKEIPALAELVAEAVAPRAGTGRDR